MKKKLSMILKKGMTLEEGCSLHLENCKQRNLREGTIRHYKDCYVQFKKYFSAEMLLSDMTEKKYQEYLLYLKSNLGSDETVRTYVRSLRTVFYFLMREGYMQPFKIKEIKADHHAIDTYDHPDSWIPERRKKQQYYFTVLKEHVRTDYHKVKRRLWKEREMDRVG